MNFKENVAGCTAAARELKAKSEIIDYWPWWNRKQVYWHYLIKNHQQSLRSRVDVEVF